MAKLVSEIQTGVRFHGGESSVDLTTGDGNEILNRAYRGLAAHLPWPELTRKDTTLSTTSDTATVDWFDAPVFLDIKILEIQDGDDNNNYRAIYPPRDYWEWSDAEALPAQAVPDYYQMNSTGEKMQVEFRPKPKYSKTIRVTGIIEPDDLRSENHKTVFLQKSADDALEHLIAAIYYSRDGFYDRANDQASKAATILGRLFGKELTPEELLNAVGRESG